MHRPCAHLILISTGTAFACAAAAAQDQDLLPDPPAGAIEVRLVLVSDQLAAAVDGQQQYLPSDMAPFPDGSGRIAVMTIGGLIRVVDGTGELLALPYHSVVTKQTDLDFPGAYGMVSIAFHPGFAQAGDPGFGRFYTIETEYTTAGAPDFSGSILPVGNGGQHHDVLYEYTATDPAADTFAGTRREIIRVLQPGRGHNMTDLTFGITPQDDGLLYIALGDGANAGEIDSAIRENPVFLGNVFGKILRIDPLGTGSANGRYGLPPGNPFIGQPGALPEIYSYGHRSAYRLTTDRATGELWLGDVGQNQVEEVNRIAPGANYGWPTKEGSFLFDELDHANTTPDPDTDANGTGDTADALGLTDPIFEVDHQTARSLTGGYVYRGSAIPELVGAYLFGDAVDRSPRGPGLYYADTTNAAPASGQTGGVRTFAMAPDSEPIPGNIISIGEDEQGELYILGISGFDGVLLRVEPPAAPCPADINGDGEATSADFFAWVVAFGNMDPECDVNNDSLCTSADFFAWVAAFGQGC